MSFGAHYLDRYYGGPNPVARRASLFLHGEGPSPALGPVEFFSALGFDPETVPEAVEQIRRDRDRLIDEARD